jgi:hypothetical protein
MAGTNWSGAHTFQLSYSITPSAGLLVEVA